MERRQIAFFLTILAVFAPCTALADDKPPTITIVFPQRAASLSGPPQVVVHGIAEDVGTGVRRVEVNGQAVSLFDGSHFSAPIALEFGTNIFTARAADGAGNQASVSWSVLYAGSYLPLSVPVENAVAIRLGADALISLENEIADLDLNPIQVGKATASVELVPGGFHLILDLKHVSSANPEFTSKSANVDAMLEVRAANGKFATSMQGFPAVTLTKFRSATTPEQLIELAVAAAIQKSLPPRLDATLGDLIQPRSFGQGVVVQTSPRAISIDRRDVRMYADGLVAPSLPPLPNNPPGSLSRNGATTAAPALTTPMDVSLSIREDMLNRILHQAWVSGAGKLRIDQQFLNQAGIRPPITLDASLLAPFFPALPPAPGGQPAPLAFELELGLPPVVEVTGTPSLLTTSMGEMALSIQLDFGQGFVEVLGLVVHSEMSAQSDVVNGQLVIMVGDPTRIAASLENNPLGLSQADIDQFVNVSLPLLITAAQTLIPPFPLPSLLSSLPKELKPKNVSIRQDGEGADFVTIEGDL